MINPQHSSIRLIARIALENIETRSPEDRRSIYNGLAAIMPSLEERNMAARVVDHLAVAERAQLDFLAVLRPVTEARQ